MKLIRSLNHLPPFAQGCALTIGNFDGVHRGHQAVFAQLREAATRLGLPAVVMTFDPQPQEFFLKDCPARLTRLREKLCYFSQAGIDGVVCLRFNKAFSELKPQAFVKELLLEKLQVKHLLIGDDFRFGYQRAGDYALLKAMAQKYHFSVAAAEMLQDAQGERVSSTQIRGLLVMGAFQKVTALLGHPYVMMGRVVHGDKLGRTLGFPTANIPLHRRKSPLHGVFAVKIHGLDNRVYLGAANLGNRPAVGGQKMLLEVHFFDFNQAIYGKLLQIEFCHKLRDEENFDSLELLTAQIAKDVQEAKDYFHDRL